MNYVRYKVRYQTLVHGVQYARVIPIGDEQNVFEMFQIEDINALEPGELAVRIMYIYFFFPLLESRGQRLQVWVSDEYFLEADTGCPNRKIRLFQVGERIDIGVVHRSV